MTETFYDVLGVSEDATQEAITDAYRQKVKEYHPDVAETDDTDDVFKRVVQAEEVLGDEEERARYDRLGHDAYVRRVEGGNAASNEQSPWTTEDRRDQSHEVGFGGVGAAAAGAGPGAGATTTARTSRAGTSTAGGVGDAESSMGFGRAASRQSSAGWSDDTDSYSRWEDDSYAEGGVGDDSTYAVHDWDDAEAGPDTVTFQVNQRFIIFAVALFFLYPMTAYLALSPTFLPAVNLIGGLFVLLMIGFSLTVPKLSLISFGAWSVLAPLLALTVVQWGLWVEVLAVLLCWVPFGYAAVVAYFTRPS